MRCITSVSAGTYLLWMADGRWTYKQKNTPTTFSISCISTVSLAGDKYTTFTPAKVEWALSGVSYCGKYFLHFIPRVAANGINLISFVNFRCYLSLETSLMFFITSSVFFFVFFTVYIRLRPHVIVSWHLLPLRSHGNVLGKKWKISLS